MAQPLGTTRSLGRTFVSVRLVSLSVRHAYALALKRWVSNPSERTIARLRYSLGGDRPSQTAHHALSQHRLIGAWLEPRNKKGGISRMTPLQLAPKFHRLPPILHILSPDSIQSYSKAAWGLSVYLRVHCIFTAISTSLGISRRQRGCRYVIHAGQNLPDKEFRYLRTVIVTAAVYSGFILERKPLHLTFEHRADVRPYTSSYEFAESCVFDKQSQPPFLCYHLKRKLKMATLIPKLRAYFAEFLRDT